MPGVRRLSLRRFPYSVFHTVEVDEIVLLQFGTGHGARCRSPPSLARRALAARHARRMRATTSATPPVPDPAHDRSLDRPAWIAAQSLMTWPRRTIRWRARAPAASDDLVLNTISALREFERIEGLVAPLDVAVFRRNRAKIAKLPTCPPAVSGSPRSQPRKTFEQSRVEAICSGPRCSRETATLVGWMT